MIHISIQRNGVEVNGGDFPDQQSADAWIGQCQNDPVLPWGDPSTYTIVPTDTTVQYDLDQEVEECIRSQPQGNKIVAYMLNADRKKLQSGGIQVQDAIDVVNDATLTTIRELLYAGSIPLAKLMISQLSTPYMIYSADDLTALLAYITYLGF